MQTSFEIVVICTASAARLELYALGEAGKLSVQRCGRPGGWAESSNLGGACQAGSSQLCGQVWISATSTAPCVAISLQV